MYGIICVLLAVISVFVTPMPAHASNYRMEKVQDGIYAAIALPGGNAESNAMVIITPHEVVLAGAHFSLEGTRELVADVAKLSPLPIRHIIITHHHKGYNAFDFDLPPTAEVITSWQAWMAIKSEFRTMKNPVLYFDKGMTLQLGGGAIVLTNTDRGHSEGDVFIYVPSADVLFTSDLVYNNVVGYMGSGHMKDWVVTLQFLESIGAKTVIPGLGDLTDTAGIGRFTTFFRDFLTETLRHVEKGESLSQTMKGFRLPQYERLPGFRTFFRVNLEQAYRELKGEAQKPQ